MPRSQLNTAVPTVERDAHPYAPPLILARSTGPSCPPASSETAPRRGPESFPLRLCPGLGWSLGWSLGCLALFPGSPVSPYQSHVPRQAGITLHTWGRGRDGA